MTIIKKYIDKIKYKLSHAKCNVCHEMNHKDDLYVMDRDRSLDCDCGYVRTTGSCPECTERLIQNYREDSVFENLSIRRLNCGSYKSVPLGKPKIKRSHKKEN